MERFKAQLNVMFDILVGKRQALTQILTISENQEAVLVSKLDSDEISAYFVAMNDEKQHLIDDVIKSDDLFQAIFDSIKTVFDQNAREHKEEITALQSEIKALIEMDAKIRLQEEKNKQHLARLNKATKKIDLSMAAKDYLIKQYGKNASKE